jgi:lipopolysaccharide transport system permease protein
MLLFTLLFSLIVKMPSEGVPYAAFAYTALLPWTYFSTALSNGTNGLVSNSQLITKVYFPREILPLTYVIAALFDLMIASSVMLALMIYYKISFTLHLLYVIPIILVLTLFVSAMSLLLSALQVRRRDFGLAMPLLLQLWMFATPVAYPLSAVPERLRGLYMLNPMVGIIENFRRAVLHGLAPDLWSLTLSGVIEFFCAELGLQPGFYYADAIVKRKGEDNEMDWQYRCAVLHVDHSKSVPGSFYAPHQWRLIQNDERVGAARGFTRPYRDLEE